MTNRPRSRDSEAPRERRGFGSSSELQSPDDFDEQGRPSSGRRVRRGFGSTSTTENPDDQELGEHDPRPR